MRLASIKITNISTKGARPQVVRSSGSAAKLQENVTECITGFASPALITQEASQIIGLTYLEMLDGGLKYLRDNRAS